MTRQKFLNPKAMIAFITFMNMYPPLSTDMYLPALPEMGEFFAAENFLVSLTLTIFFLTFAVSMILFGPLSDKYGRKPILVSGTVIYILASISCIFAPNIYVLLAGRFFQAVGSGAIITIATVLIKDCFSGTLMSKILAITQAFGVIAPMAAPIIGGFLLTITDWRGSFYLLTALGVINLLVALLFTETLKPEQRFSGEIFKSLTLLWTVAKQKIFMLILIMFSILAAPYMAYLSVSSFVYIEFFGLSAQEYSYFFCANSAAAVLGPIIYLRLKNFLSNVKILYICFIVAGISGFLVYFVGTISAYIFLFSFLFFTVIEAITKPFAMEILLRRTKENVGTAASMINFIPTLFGSIGMMLGPLSWSNFIHGLGIILISATIIAIGIYFLIGKKNF